MTDNAATRFGSCCLNELFVLCMTLIRFWLPWFCVCMLCILFLSIVFFAYLI